MDYLNKNQQTKKKTFVEEIDKDLNRSRSLLFWYLTIKLNPSEKIEYELRPSESNRWRIEKCVFKSLDLHECKCDDTNAIHSDFFHQVYTCI